jgi:type I restriction enzyme M protein
MRAIEKHNSEQVGGVLPKELPKKVSEIPANIDYDTFGRIYEYFLGEFARTEGQKAASSTRRARSCDSSRRSSSRTTG